MYLFVKSKKTILKLLLITVVKYRVLFYSFYENI